MNKLQAFFDECDITSPPETPYPAASERDLPLGASEAETYRNQEDSRACSYIPVTRTTLTTENQTTPHDHRIYSSAPFASNVDGWNADKICYKLFRESISSFVGFMEPKLFMEIFLPWQGKATSFQTGANVIPTFGNEEETSLYKEFVRLAEM
jgi:hypothetical protein